MPPASCEHGLVAGRILVGTCNWSEHEDFYPKGLPAADRLAYYARFFPLVEVDTTHYGIPPPDRSAAWAGSTPEGFLFNVKAYRSMTYHEREGGRPREPTDAELSAFDACLEPLRAAGKLRALHFQFPPWFSPSPLNLDRLARVRERYPDDLMVVEMRHRGWAEEARWEQLTDLLREARVSLCMVDEPQLGSGSFPLRLEITDPRLAVVRFHGRNAAAWYRGGARSGDRFNYLYSKEELRGWLGRVRRLSEEADEVHLLFNNNRANYAVQNGLEMARLLDATPPPEPTPAAPELPLGPGG